MERPDMRSNKCKNHKTVKPLKIRIHIWVHYDYKPNMLCSYLLGYFLIEYFEF